MTPENRSLSDFWRYDKAHDRTGELISILRGANTLIGNMGSDIRAQWSTNGMSYTDFKAKLVALDYAPLQDEDPPYRGAKVDEVIGYAAHEGGHCLWSREGKYDNIERYVRTAWSRMPTAFRDAYTAGKEPVLLELCRLQNILEDGFIDTKVDATWPVLGEYIRIARTRKDEHTPIDLGAIVNDPNPDRNAVVNVWVSISLYGQKLPRTGDPRVRKAVQDLMRLTRKAIAEDNPSARQIMVFDVARILWQQFPIKSAPLPQLPQSGDAGEGAGGSGGQPQSPQPDESQDEAGSGDDEDGNDDQSGTGASGDSGDESGNKPDESAGDKASGGGGGAQQELDDARGQLGKVLRQILEDAQQKAGGEGAGKIDNLDDFDPADPESDGGREVTPVPDEVISAVLDIIEREMTDISEIVAEALEEDPRGLRAHALRATYDEEKATRVIGSVKDEIEDIKRAFQRQQDISTHWLRGRDKGRLDDRRLHKPFLGDKNFRKQRVVLSQPDQDVGLLLDVSESMQDDYPVVDATAAIFTEGLRKVQGINFAAWAYTGGPTFLALTRITDSGMGGKLHLGDIRKMGGTPSGMAIVGAKSFLDVMPGRRKLLIHFTDGQPQPLGHVITAVRKCREAGIQVYAIAMKGMEKSMRAQYGEGNYETIGSVSELPNAMTQIVKRLGAPQV